MDTITIIVPCFNEHSALPHFYREYLNLVQLMNYTRIELLFIDDGSTDDTLTLIQEYAEQEAKKHKDAPTIIEFMIATDQLVLPMVKSGNPMSEMILK